MFQENTTKKFKAWHVEANARRLMCPEHKRKAIKDEVRAAGGALKMLCGLMDHCKDFNF